MRSLASFMTDKHAAAFCKLLATIYGEHDKFVIIPPTNNFAAYYLVTTSLPKSATRNIKLVINSFNAGLLAGQGIGD